MNAYQEFIASRRIAAKPSGFAFPEEWINPNAFDYQRSIIQWMIRKGKACVFADCGLGKGLILLNGCEIVAKHTGGRVLILCPLAVGHQLVREAERFGIEGVKLCRSQDDVSTPISITNYERLHLFDASHFVGVACDESSIIKSIDGHIKTEILTKFANTPYRFACTATPAPNDHMELGNHAEFVGAMKSSTMLATFFTHDGGDTSKWRLRGHAKRKFWEWVASWAVMCRTPADLGFDGSRFILPELRIVEHEIESDSVPRGYLFDPGVSNSATTMHEQKARNLGSRCQRVHDIVRNINEPFLCWVSTNYEADALKNLISDAIEIRGADSDNRKELAVRWFSGEICRCEFDRLSGARKCHGNQNTAKTRSGNTTKTKSTDSVSWSDAEAKIPNTCESTIATTRLNGSGPQSSNKRSISRKKSDTRQTQNSESCARSVREEELQLKEKTLPSRKPSGSHSTNTLTCCNLSGTSVQSADESTRRRSEEGSSLTTATPQAKYEVSSAQNATLDLGNSKTMSSGSAMPLCTCGGISNRRILISKPEIFGWGMNFQFCCKMTWFVSFSFESFYQSVRRIWRFGQSNPVECHVIYSTQELDIVQNIKRKQADADAMATGMIEAMRGFSQSELGKARSGSEYNPQQSMELPQWLSV